ncbi:NEDD4-binding protein 3-A [Diretmus argenteus]
MATSVQTLPLTRDPRKNFRDTFPASPLSSRCGMGSVGSLVERPDVSPAKGNRAVPQVRPRQTNGLLKKGFNQRELLNYLNITRKEPKPNPVSSSTKDIISGLASVSGREEDNVYTKVYHKDGTEIDLGKNSLPIGSKYEKSRLRPSAFKPVTPKNFSSMQNLYPSSKMDDMDHSLSNGLHRAYAHVPKAVSTSSSSSPSRHGGPTSSGNKALSSVRGMSQEDDNLSDSGHNSMNSLPPYRPPFRPHLAHISASMGHINTIGSLDRASLGPKAVGSVGVAMGEMVMSCRSMATLSRLAPYGGEAPPPYELTLSLSVEEVVRDLEERLVEKEHELKQMKRNLDESEGAIAQVFEGKQRLWEKEVEELKHLYAAKLRQVSQHAQRSQRSLQLQLYKAQQEKNRLQEELDSQRERSQEAGTRARGTSPTLEETQWEVCQKSGEISLLKQQLRDSQAEVTQKLSEIFQLKTQLRDNRTELRGRESQIDALKLALQGTQHRRYPSQTAHDDGRGAEESTSSGATGGCGGPTEERLRAELLLERRQSEAQAMAFEDERQTWQTEKDKVIRYQKELQASYLEMYHHNEALERELHQLRAGRERAGGDERKDSRNGTLESEVVELRSKAAGEKEDRPASGLPWIERIESSEI